MYAFSLKNQKEFDLVNKTSAKVHGAFFIIIISRVLPPTSQPDTFAFGMKVSRRFSKKAVIRNKVKRRIRHLVRIAADKLGDVIANHSVIIIPKHGFNTTDFSDLSLNFNNVIAKAAPRLQIKNTGI